MKPSRKPSRVRITLPSPLLKWALALAKKRKQTLSEMIEVRLVVLQLVQKMTKK